MIEVNRIFFILGYQDIVESVEVLITGGNQVAAEFAGVGGAAALPEYLVVVGLRLSGGDGW